MVYSAVVAGGHDSRVAAGESWRRNMSAERFWKVAVVAFGVGLGANCRAVARGDDAPDAGVELREPAARGPFGVGTTTRLFTRASSTTGLARPLETVLWYPTDSPEEPTAVLDAPPSSSGRLFPLVVYSHGLCGEPRQALYLTEHLASWGYVVAAPPHPGNTAADEPCEAPSIADALFNRVPDVLFTLDSLLALRADLAEPLGRVLDPARTVAAGYSFGGWTALTAAAGGRFDLVISLAPAPAPLLYDKAPLVHAPVLFEGAGKDWRVAPFELDRVFNSLPAAVPRRFYFFPEAGHHAFGDRCTRECAFPQERAHELTRRWTVSFLQVFLLGDLRFEPFLLEAEPEVVSVPSRECEPGACAALSLGCCPGADGCVDFSRDMKHCGGCQNACAAGWACVSGTCTDGCTETQRQACNGYGCDCSNGTCKGGFCQ